MSDQDSGNRPWGRAARWRPCVEAREQGLTRFIGVTGHDWPSPACTCAAWSAFDFDSVLLPYNYMMMQNPQYAADFEALMAVCQERNVAVQTIKSICRRPWGDRPHTRATWYEPLEDQADIDHGRALRVGLARSSFLNTVGDIHVLPRVLDAASRFQAGQPPPEMAKLVERQAMEPLFA